MRHRWLMMATCLALSPALVAQEKEKPKAEPSSQEAFQAILTELRKTQMKDIEAFRAAKTDEERDKALESYIEKGNAVAGKVLDLAKKDPKNPGPLSWLINNTSGKESEEAMALLLKEDPKQAGQIAQSLARMPFKHVEKSIRTLREKATDREAKGNATLALAQFLLSKSERSEKDRETLQKEAETLFDEVLTKYGHLDGARGKLADVAKDQLFILKHLSVGQPAPEIDGKDFDGKAFKLSEYKGRVVMLDFWGHW